GTEGLVHISELQHGRTEKTEDVVKKGDRVRVKLIDVDERGRLRLSMKALVPKPEGMEETGDGRRGERGERERGERPRGGERERAAAGAGSEGEGEEGAAEESAPAAAEGGRPRSR